MPAGRSGSGDIPAELGVPAADLGAGRPELRAIAAVGRTIRGGKQVVAAGCCNTTGPTAGSRPEVCIISISTYLTCPGICLIYPVRHITTISAYLIRPAGCLISTAAYLIYPSGHITTASAYLIRAAGCLISRPAYLICPVVCITTIPTAVMRPAAEMTQPGERMMRAAVEMRQPAGRMTRELG